MIYADFVSLLHGSGPRPWLRGAPSGEWTAQQAIKIYVVPYVFSRTNQRLTKFCTTICRVPKNTQIVFLTELSTKFDNF